MSGSNQRRRRASGVLAEAIRKDLERDANAGAETDAHRRRERRNSAAFRRASFQAANAVGPAPPAGVKKLGKMAKDDDEMERQQQGLSARRRSSTTGNLVRRGSGSNAHTQDGRRYRKGGVRSTTRSRQQSHRRQLLGTPNDRQMRPMKMKKKKVMMMMMLLSWHALPTLRVDLSQDIALRHRL